MADGNPSGAQPVKSEIGGPQYFGNREIIYLCIKAFEESSPSSMKGSYGEVRKIEINKKPYFVKRVIVKLKGGSEADIRKYKIGQVLIESEIKISNHFTNKIPDSVSNLRGAYMNLEGEMSVGYLIYEAPQGMNLRQYMQKNPPNPDDKKQNKIYEKLYCSLKKAQAEINRLGFVHTDINPNNIYIVLETGHDPKCKLIDFGLTRKAGIRFTARGTDGYVPPEMMPDSIRPAHVKKYEGLTTTAHNDYSVDVIWRNDFYQGNRPPPDCTAAAGPPLPPMSEEEKAGGKRSIRLRSKPKRKTRRLK
jgi:serine/threonine protein kinase